jgi:ABC-type nitrate/sulfonate/bicarbonate transport system substrate-binding protein
MRMSWIRRSVTAFAALAVLAPLTSGPAPAADPPLTVVRYAVNPHFITFAAVFDAVDKGYFRDAGIDLQITKYTTSANAMLPSLARGDLDITAVVPGPALFNQFDQGFNIKLVGSVDEPHAGYLDGSVLVVRKDVWDAGTIRKPSDLAGKTIDGAFAGSPISLLTLEAIAAGDLKLSDVKYATREADVGQQFAALNNKVVDVQGTTEPTATAMVAKGVGVKWLSYRDVIPWYTDSYWGVSAAFAKDHPDVVVKFLQAYLKGEQDIEKTHGKLTPDLIATISKWTEIDPDTIKSLGVTPYFGNYGTINADALDRVQKFWMQGGLVKTPVPIDRIIDTAPLAAARKAVGIK